MKIILFKFILQSLRPRFIRFKQICQKIKSDNAWTVVQSNPLTVGPYAFKGNLWVTFSLKHHNHNMTINLKL